MKLPIYMDNHATTPMDPRVFHRFLGRPAERVVAAGGVAELLVKVRQHRFDHALVHRSGGVVIHVNRQFNRHAGFSLGYCNPLNLVFPCRKRSATADLIRQDYVDSPTNSASGESSVICEIVTARKTWAMLSFTRRSGSRTVHVELCPQFPWLVTQYVITSGPSTALMTSSAEISFGWRAN